MARSIAHLTPAAFTRRSLFAPVPAGRALLHVRLFGRIRVEAGRERAAVSLPNRTLPTLAYLLLHRREPISRNQLAASLWPDDDEASARTRLRSNLHALVHALPSSTEFAWLSRAGDALQWNPAAPLTFDVADFEALAADPQRLADAVALYGGELAEGLEADWLTTERDRYRRLAVTALEGLVAAHRARRAFAPALVAARRLLEIDPWREDIVRRVISMRYESGDRAGALAEFDAFARRLELELGNAPMPETLLLRDQLARAAPVVADASGSSSVPAVFAPEREQQLPFVGRQREFGMLVERWTRAAAGHGGTVLIAGEAGIGKTRLTNELQRHVEDSGGRVLRGCTTFPEAIPYQSLVEALRGALPLVAAAELPAVWLGAMSVLLPELRQHLADASALHPLDSERERQRLFEAIVRVLLALAAPRPVLLVVEDVHWANETTLAALSFLTRRVALAPVLIVATYRDEETPREHAVRRLRRELQAQGLADCLAPEPLQVVDVSRVLSGFPGLRERADAPTLLHTGSGGNPLFLTHLIQSLLDGDTQQLPQPLQLLLAGRIARLPERARTLVEIAASIGQLFSLEILRELTGWEERDVIAALDELIERRLIREVGLSRRFEYGFAHQLVQLAVVASIPELVARRRHRQIALVIEGLRSGLGSDVSSELARHYELAGEPDAAARCYLDAARRADLLSAHDEALAHLSRGLAQACSRTQRVDLLLEREALRSRRGDRSGQRSDLDDLANLATSDKESELTREVLYRRAELAGATGERDEQGSLLAELRRRAEGLAGWESRLLFAEAKYLARLGHFAETNATAKRAIAACRAAGDTSKQVQLLCILAKMQAHRELPGESESLLQEAARLADSAASALFVLDERTHLAVLRDDDARREELCLELAALCRSVGDRKGEASALERLGIATLLHDRYSEAEGLFAQAQAIGEEIDDRQRVASVNVNRAHLDMILGSFEEATAAVARALAINEAQGEFYSVLACVNNLSALATLSGDGKRARQLALDALELAGRQGAVVYQAVAYENLAEAENACGDLAAAIAAMEASLAKRRAVDSSVGVAFGTAHLSLWYLAAGQVHTARERVAEMLRSESTIRVGNPWPQLCYWAAAQVCRALGERDRARVLLERAYAMVSEKAGKCPDARRRHSFLDLPWHRDIVAAHDAGRWPEHRQ